VLTACNGAGGDPPSPGSTAATTTTVTGSTVPGTGDATSTTAEDPGIVPDLPTTTVSVGDASFREWLADDSAERGQGRRGVKGMPPGIDGMLFAWDSATNAVFVMEETLIPLDVWFFDGDGVLVGSHTMSPCSVEPCPRYAAPGPVTHALETPAGEREFRAGVRISTSASG